MGNEVIEDTVTLIDENGIEMEFEVLDSIENENGHFYALLPNFDIPDISPEDETYFIFQSIKDDINGEEKLEEVEDEKILDELSVIFEKHFDEKYNYEEEI